MIVTYNGSRYAVRPVRPCGYCNQHRPGRYISTPEVASRWGHVVDPGHRLVFECDTCRQHTLGGVA